MTMPQIIGCPKCSVPLSVPDGSVGKQVRCPKCQTVFPIPAPQPVGVAAPGEAPSGPPPGPVPQPSGGGAPSAPTAPQRPTGPPTKCPACGSDLNPGAIACMDCGYLIQSDTVTSSEMEGPPNLCTNPACGVANPPGERNCQRCSTPLPVAAGTLIHGRYRLDKLLAMGGFGAVYKATDTKAGNREVAIKDMITGDAGEFAIRLTFFRREAEILRSLEPVPIVPRVYDFIHEGQTARLVIEFIRGTDLLKIMEANGNQPFDLRLIVEWGKAICDVLD